MKLYVASKYEESEKCNALCHLLEDGGHTITYKWWTEDWDNVSAALLDLDGVRRADAIVLVMERELPYRGAFVEMGIALALGKPVYVLGTFVDKCVFVHHPLVRRGPPEARQTR